MIIIGQSKYNERCKAVGAHNIDEDTFAVNADIIENFYEQMDSGIYMGHEMVIYGYDDNASYQVYDRNLDKNITKKGLFLVRNSWGTNTGDHGEYYMSYDYFENFADEIFSIHQ